MNWLWIMIILVACLYLIPWCITFALRIVLWRYHFKAGVGGFLTYENILFRYQIKMNCALIV